MYQIKYNVKINNKKISLSFHDLILIVHQQMALYGPCVKIVTAQRNTIKINCIPPKTIILHSQFHITTTCHTRQEPIPFLPATN